MSVLAIDTTGERLSLAFGSSTVQSRSRSRATRRHDEILLPEIERLLKTCKSKVGDIEAVVAATGPGRFTGIRIGLTFAKFFAAGLNVPAVGVSHFAAWGAAHKSAGKKGRVCLVFPGPREDRYSQLLETGPQGARPLGQAQYLAPKSTATHPEGALLVTHSSPGMAAKYLIDAALKQLPNPTPPVPLYLKPASYER
jgi:tRNA threonylcarbamoyladenosine biosynthesis protein TsaB